MDISSIKPNTDEYLEKEEKTKNRPPLEPAIQGSGRIGNKSLLRTFLEFSSGESINTLKRRMYDIAIGWIFDSIHSGIENINDAIFAGKGSSAPRSKNRDDEHTSYDKFYKRRNRGRSGKKNPGKSGNGEYEDLYFNYKWQAQEVLKSITKYFEDWEVLSVANLYQAANVYQDEDVPTDYTDDLYGWHSIKGARIEKYGGKYYLIMPSKPISLNKDKGGNK